MKAFYIFTVFCVFTVSTSICGEAAEVTIDLICPTVVEPDTTFEVSINVSHVNDLDTVQFSLLFNPLVIQAGKNDVTLEGTITEGANLVVNDTKVGELIVIINLPGISGVDGEGSLAKIDFHAVGTYNSSTNLILSSVLLGDTEAHLIYYSSGDIVKEISLPVELSQFFATFSKADDGVILRWKTESQINNFGWNIYRADGNEREYKKIGFVEGAGTEATPMEYQFLDDDIIKGKTYYYYLEDLAFDGTRGRTSKIKVIILASRQKVLTTWGKLKREVY